MVVQEQAEMGEDEAVYKELDDSLVRVATTASSLEAEQDSGNTFRSGEDSLKLNELMELCTNLQTRVLNLEKTKTTQSNEIDNLKMRVKRLEKKKRSRTQGLKRLYKVCVTAAKLKYKGLKTKQKRFGLEVEVWVWLVARLRLGSGSGNGSDAQSKVVSSGMTRGITPLADRLSQVLAILGMDPEGN
ncbi:hypothetical protein Tco_1041913 [Tanacetum coccineum]|uniref:Uncharacterized protein n=1 Tax=Tanacetum coccineum TaxID=301880 RepID=A0ABQ5GK83_9ASTR